MVIFNPIVGEIECVRSLRARSIRLIVRADGSLRLTYPLFTPLRQAITFAEKKSEWIAKTRMRIATTTANYPTITTAERERLRREAHRTLPPLVESLASHFGFTYTSLRISSARTRWGVVQRKERHQPFALRDAPPRPPTRVYHPPRALPHTPPQPLHGFSHATQHPCRRQREGP